jgi:hypothetical protein
VINVCLSCASQWVNAPPRVDTIPKIRKRTTRQKIGVVRSSLIISRMPPHPRAICHTRGHGIILHKKNTRIEVKTEKKAQSKNGAIDNKCRFKLFFFLIFFIETHFHGVPMVVAQFIYTFPPLFLWGGGWGVGTRVRTQHTSSTSGAFL